MFITNYKKETEYIVTNLQKTFEEKGFKKAVIGISGGIDSAVVATLLVQTLGKSNVFGLMLPCGEQKDIEDSRLLCKKLGINNITRDISSIVKSYPLYFDKYSEKEEKLRKGNICARVRMIVLYDYSSMYNALVVGTGNKTELLLGYFTLHGDGACAIEPIGHLYKTEVRGLAKYLKVPKQIIEKAPSAGLWEGQTDEKELGITYEEADKILYGLQEEGSVLNFNNLKILNKFKTEKIKMLVLRQKNNAFKTEPSVIFERKNNVS